MDVKAFISQSNYIPWKGYFDAIDKADVFVVYDDMQYTRQDWRNRNLIITPQGLKWLSIPVEMKGRLNKKIREVKVADNNWNRVHIETIKQAYKSALCYKEMIEWIEPLFRNCKYEFLSDINLYFIEKINSFLGINTEIKHSSDFHLKEDRNERLIHLCNDLNVSKYLSGAAAKAYLKEDLFIDNNIQVEFLDYSHYEKYTQLHSGDFEHGVSILDLILNEGENAKLLFRNSKEIIITK
jgi:hypothetical protein